MKTMKDKKIAQIPFYVHESEMLRMERITRRLCIAVIALAVSNVIVYRS